MIVSDTAMTILLFRSSSQFRVAFLKGNFGKEELLESEGVKLLRCSWYVPATCENVSRQRQGWWHVGTSSHLALCGLMGALIAVI